MLLGINAATTVILFIMAAKISNPAYTQVKLDCTDLLLLDAAYRMREALIAVNNLNEQLVN